MKQKNTSIEAFRFIFMVILCLWHINDMIEFFHHAYLVVEFFFILSGIFLYQAYINNCEQSTIGYIFKRVKRLWIQYFIIICIVFLMYKRQAISEMTITFYDVFQFISDLLLIQDIGFLLPPNNWATWYLSVLIISSGCLYSFIKNYHRQAVTLYLPLICILSYCYLFSYNPSLDKLWSSEGPFFLPLLRGTTDMSFGVILSYLFVSRPFLQNSKNALIDLVSIASLFFIIIIMVLRETFDSYVILFLPLFILGLYNETSLLNRCFRSKIWLFLGGLSYKMYLTHIIIRGIVRTYYSPEMTPPLLLVFVYLLLVIVSAYLLKAISKKIRLANI